MFTRYGLRIAPRTVLPRMFAAVAAVAASTTAGAGATPGKDKVYAAFFLGQGGYMFSWGVSHLEQETRKLGITTRVYDYSDVSTAWADIARKRKQGYRIALVGYSLGNTTTTYLQQHVSVDLLLAIAESSLGMNHPVIKRNTRRAVLWWGPDTLSNAGTRDGFDVTNYVDNTHLLMDVDSRVVTGVLAELRSFAARPTPARLALPVIAGPRIGPPAAPTTAADGKTAAGTRPAGAAPSAARSPSPKSDIKSDIKSNIRSDAGTDATRRDAQAVPAGGAAAPANPVR